MKKKYEEKIFSYIEPFSKRIEDKLPNTLRLDNISKEGLLFRLLLGTLDFKKCNEPVIMQRNNYATIPFSKNNVNGIKSIYKSSVQIKGYVDDFDKYMNLNRKNTPMYEKILFEFSNYFDQYLKGSYTAAFIHLYRMLEYFSLCFPLIYVSKSGDYKKSFDALKSFFSPESKSELKLTKIFLEALYQNSGISILDVKASIKLTAPNEEMLHIYKQIMLDMSAGLDTEIIDENFLIEYRSLFDVMINIRNHYFHMLLGTSNENIATTDIDHNDFFRCIDEPFANWLAYVFFSVVTYGVENL